MWKPNKEKSHCQPLIDTLLADGWLPHQIKLHVLIFGVKGASTTDKYKTLKLLGVHRDKMNNLLNRLFSHSQTTLHNLILQRRILEAEQKVEKTKAADKVEDQDVGDEDYEYDEEVTKRRNARASPSTRTTCSILDANALDQAHKIIARRRLVPPRNSS